MKNAFTLISLLLVTLAFVGCSEEIPEKEPINISNEVEVTHFYNGIPKVKITTVDLEEITSRTEYIDGQIDIYENNGADITFNKEIRIRGRGNSTWTSPKKPYQFRFDDKESILGMPADKRWILLTNYKDKSMMRTESGFHMSRMSYLDWTPESKFIDLFINTEYLGTYQLTQKVEETDDRVDLSNDGYLLEVDKLERLDEDDVYFETDKYLYNIKEPNLEEGDDAYNYIETFLNETEDAIFGADYLDPQIGYRKYIDVETFVDWYLINEITKNNDADFHTSVFMNLEPGGKIKMGPVWDFDLSAGNINYNGNELPEGFWMKRGKWVSRFYDDPEFVALVKERFDFYYNSRTEIYDVIRDNADYIDDSQVVNFEKWEILGEYVWPNFVYFDTYQEEVDYLIQWQEDRFQWLKVAFDEL